MFLRNEVSEKEKKKNVEGMLKSKLLRDQDPCACNGIQESSGVALES